jgi:hypothetical protein
MPKRIVINLTDGAGNGGFGIIVNTDSLLWSDNSSSNHEISSTTQGGAVSEQAQGLVCSDGVGCNVLVLKSGHFDMKKDDSGDAEHQLDGASPKDTNWTWYCMA